MRWYGGELTWSKLQPGMQGRKRSEAMEEVGSWLLFSAGCNDAVDVCSYALWREETEEILGIPVVVPRRSSFVPSRRVPCERGPHDCNDLRV